MELAIEELGGDGGPSCAPAASPYDLIAMPETALKIAQHLRLLDWCFLSMGWDRGWITKQEVIQHAVRTLECNDANSDDEILLASAESEAEAEITARLARLCGSEVNAQIATDKWRLIRLVELANSTYSDQEKIDQLQLVYAEFDYPDDMVRCSVYGPSQEGSSSRTSQSEDWKTDPLDSMSDVIEALAHRLCPAQWQNGDISRQH